jgi:hypothetical protein
MRVAGSHWRSGCKPIQTLLGWIFAAFIVVVAVFGPPLTGQSIPALVELRHDVLMMDRELERSSIRTNMSSARTSTLVFDDFVPGSSIAGSRTPVPRGAP